MPKSANIIRKIDNEYPTLLREIASPPKRLWIEGKMPPPDAQYFAIVGTRRATPYGKKIAQGFSTALAENGFVIVSGLAHGIDGIAHEAALAAGGKTIAVLGAGLNHITPTLHIPLAERIKKNGALITEFAPDIAPNKGTFPQRNRIIAGMSIATLVVEAPLKSGALITARLAVQENRDVFAIPGNISQETSEGTNLLIQKGQAHPVMRVEDIFEYLEIDFKKQTNGSSVVRLPSFEQTIFEYLKRAPYSIDELIAEIGSDAAKIASAISILEMKGLVTMVGSQAFVTR